MLPDLNQPNRRMRTRMSGGVAGDRRDEPVGPYADRCESPRRSASSDTISTHPGHGKAADGNGFEMKLLEAVCK